jgi:pimeloyl-ACP methyl ester carboxylesterase
MGTTTVPARHLAIGDVDIELFEEGQGAPLLFLHSAQGFHPNHPFVGRLTAQRRVVAPSHPGFGHSSLPDWIDCVDDIAHIYLELIDRLGLGPVDVVGCSVGGWIAADLASKVPHVVRRLVLVGPVGVKTGPRDRLDIPDIYAMQPDAVTRLMFHDPEKARLDVSAMSDEELGVIARNRETLALLVWEPWMHNPKLTHRLHRVMAPTLLMRGASDGLVSAEYLARYAKLFPNARTTEIAGAGHAVQIEQPEEFVRTVLTFLNA